MIFHISIVEDRESENISGCRPTWCSRKENSSQWRRWLSTGMNWEPQNYQTHRKSRKTNLRTQICDYCFIAGVVRTFIWWPFGSCSLEPLLWASNHYSIMGCDRSWIYHKRLSKRFVAAQRCNRERVCLLWSSSRRTRLSHVRSHSPDSITLWCIVLCCEAFKISKIALCFCILELLCIM